MEGLSFMKILNKTFVAALLLSLGTATPLLATTLAPNGTVSPLTTTPGALTTVFASTYGLQSFAFGGPSGPFPFPLDTGFVEEVVGTSAFNPYGASALTFEYQFKVTGGVAGDIAFLTGANFQGVSTDVSQYAGFLAGFSGTRRTNEIKSG